MRRILTVLVIAIGLTVALSAVALAAPAAGKGGALNPEKAKKRISNEIKRAEQMKAKSVAKLKKADERLTKAMDQLKAQGKDISKLTADRDVLASKVQSADKDVEAFINKLKDAEGLAATATIEQFKAALVSAKELRRRVKADVKDIKVYMKTVILRDIRNLKGNTNSSAGQLQLNGI
jgi:hypothetical protein